MINLNERIERLELAASDCAMLAGLHWDFAERDKARQEGQAFRRAAQVLRDEQFEEAPIS